MNRVRHRWLMLVLMIGLGSPAWCAPLADSIADFSGAQGQDHWFYGFYDQGVVGGLPHGYSTNGFIELGIFSDDPSVPRWTASDLQVGAQNNVFLSVDALGGHPTGIGPGDQDHLIWAVRRYQSPVNGLIDISIDLKKLNVVNPGGGGITGRVFVDGAEVFTQLIDNIDAVGVQRTLRANVAIGSFIDFAIDATGITPGAGSDGIYSARADGSQFSAVIAIVPEPSSLLMLSIGGVALGVLLPRSRKNVKSRL